MGAAGGSVDRNAHFHTRTVSSVSVEPPYPHVHGGPVLVCGAAACLGEDVEAAWALRPGAPVIAVNKAVKSIKPFAHFTLHPEHLGHWLEAGELVWGRRDWTTHSGGAGRRLRANRAAWPQVDYWWAEARGAGTSTWAAARMARLMGFQEIILCGMPLEPMPYADGSPAKAFNRPEKIAVYRAFIRGDTAWHAGVRAMSGWPRQIFGPPQAKDKP